MALVQENSRPPRHRPPRVDLRHVIDMTLVDGDPGSAGTATTSEEENGCAQGAAAEDHSQVWGTAVSLREWGADLFTASFSRFSYCLSKTRTPLQPFLARWPPFNFLTPIP
jgi:hypothetical protein